jgi:hypothetical protein
MTAIKTVCNRCGLGACGRQVTVKGECAVQVHGDKDHPEHNEVPYPKTSCV